jgi:hypothetical protein
MSNAGDVCSRDLRNVPRADKSHHVLDLGRDQPQGPRHTALSSRGERE